MPRGMRGTGPGARKRLQRELQAETESDAYVKLYLTQEEAKLLYDGLRALPAEVGTRNSALVMNILYRITEQIVMQATPTSLKAVVKKVTKGQKRR